MGYGLIFTLDFTQTIFMLDSSNVEVMSFAAVAGLIGATLIEILWWVLRSVTKSEKPVWMPKQERAAAAAQRRIEREARRTEKEAEGRVHESSRV